MVSHWLGDQYVSHIILSTSMSVELSSSSSIQNTLSHVIHPQARRHPIICGLLGATSAFDHWMATDFVVLRELIGDRDDRNIWLCGTSIRLETFLLGDPACDRIFDPPPFETVCEEDPVMLRASFLFKVAKVALTLSEEDVLVLVLAGHGALGGVFKIGDEDGNVCELTKGELEKFLGDTKATVWLINTACFSGAWESPKWTLLAAAQADEEAPSLAVSASEKVRGGFFVNALVAQHANEFKIIAPCPASVDDNGNRGQQHPHDFSPGKSVRPSGSTPKRSLDGVRDWIHSWRDHIGRVYTSASLCFRPCPPASTSEPRSMPFRSLESQTAALHQFRCVPSSTAGCETPSCSANSGSSLPHSSIKTISKLSADDEKLLISLAEDLLQFQKPIQTARETPTIVMCHRVLGGRNPLDDAEKGRLLSVLKNRRQYQELAVAIAKNLGWGKLVDELGRPDGEQARLSSMFGLQQKAKVSGCLVTVLIQRHSLGQYSGAAGWLARMWEAAGSPSIASQVWKSAIERSRMTNSDHNSSSVVIG
jgi:hypothetical protein